MSVEINDQYNLLTSVGDPTTIDKILRALHEIKQIINVGIVRHTSNLEMIYNYLSPSNP